ncbi:MAG: Txe/YoeB family addiction module toxin [Ignavibacteriaceae bacterium]|nr:Txe/YoeB family addiction module toxin [Ignavibacteriaceae bacterium]
MWDLYFTSQAEKDSLKLKSSHLKQKAEKILEILREDPFRNPALYEKLAGDLSGLFSRRINIQHKIVYQILTEEKAVKILSMWTHYE